MRARCPIAELLLVGTPSREIVRVADGQQADVVVMGAQGRSALSVAFFGSTTQHVVRAATCPVLTVRVAEWSLCGRRHEEAAGVVRASRR